MEAKKVIETIKKVLDLSKNNPSQEEASAAALKAQELMAKYHIQVADLDGIEDCENIVECEAEVGNGNKWKYELASVIARNFRCRTYSIGNDTIVFYGFETDAEIAKETFSSLFKVGNKAATNFYQNRRNECKRNGWYFDGSGLKNSFLLGYIDGIKDALDKQCTALMLVVPKEVNEKYEEKAKGMRTCRNSIRALNDAQVRQVGFYKGREAMGGRQLSGATA